MQFEHSVEWIILNNLRPKMNFMLFSLRRKYLKNKKKEGRKVSLSPSIISLNFFLSSDIE